MKYKYILFDLDGTLTESGPGILNSVEYSLKKMGVDSPGRDILKKFIGPPLLESFQNVIGMTEEQSKQAIDCYREYYATKGIFENTVYCGIIESLKLLKDSGKILAIATSKPELFAKRIAEHYHFAEYFTVIGGATMDESLVAKPDIIRNVLKELNISDEDKAQVLMVGDRKHDILGAKENRIDSLGVLYGYGDRQELELAGAEYIVEQAEEIASCIMDLDRE